MRDLLKNLYTLTCTQKCSNNNRSITRGIWCHALSVYINGLDSMDCPFLLVVTSPWESAVFVVITVNRPLSYLGKFSHRLYILPRRYRYTIHEYWSSSHWCHIQEKKHRIRRYLEQQTYWLMKKKLKGINSGPNRWRARGLPILPWHESFFPLKFIFFLHVLSV